MKLSKKVLKNGDKTLGSTNIYEYIIFFQLLPKYLISSWILEEIFCMQVQIIQKKCHTCCQSPKKKRLDREIEHQFVITKGHIV